MSAVFSQKKSLKILNRFETLYKHKNTNMTTPISNVTLDHDISRGTLSWLRRLASTLEEDGDVKDRSYAVVKDSSAMVELVGSVKDCLTAVAVVGLVVATVNDALIESVCIAPTPLVKLWNVAATAMEYFTPVVSLVILTVVAVASAMAEPSCWVSCLW